jgi:outer membrane assembly lipoprotein YfiO
MIWSGHGWAKAPPPAPGSAEGDLADIRSLIDSGQNARAIKAVDKVLLAHPSSSAREEAMNLAGQARMNQGRYWDAYDWFERQLANYPNGVFFDRALDREFTIARAFLQGRRRRAMKIFRVSARDDGIDILMRIAAHSPGSDLAERALLQVADYHYDRREYPEAIAVYDEFAKSHPRSGRRAYAMLRSARASLLTFRGIKWDETPLLDASVRFRVFARAYPAQAKRENIAGILAEIRQTLAHKVFYSGTFYERTNSPRSAVFYYRKVLREYPDSQWANDARQRLDRLAPMAVEQVDTPARGQAETSAAEKQAKRADQASARRQGHPRRVTTRPIRGKGRIVEKKKSTAGDTRLSQADAQPAPEPVKKSEKTPSPIRLESLSDN